MPYYKIRETPPRRAFELPRPKPPSISLCHRWASDNDKLASALEKLRQSWQFMHRPMAKIKQRCRIIFRTSGKTRVRTANKILRELEDIAPTPQESSVERAASPCPSSMYTVIAWVEAEGQVASPFLADEDNVLEEGPFDDVSTLVASDDKNVCNDDDASTIKPPKLSVDPHDVLLESLHEILTDFYNLARHQQLYEHNGTHFAPSGYAISVLPIHHYFDAVIRNLDREKRRLIHRYPGSTPCAFHHVFEEAVRLCTAEPTSIAGAPDVDSNLTPELLEESFRIYAVRAYMHLRSFGGPIDISGLDDMDQWRVFAEMTQQDFDHIIYWEPSYERQDEETFQRWQTLVEMNLRTRRTWFAELRTVHVDLEKFSHGVGFKLTKGAMAALNRNARRAQLVATE